MGSFQRGIAWSGTRAPGPEGWAGAPPLGWVHHHCRPFGAFFNLLEENTNRLSGVHTTQIGPALGPPLLWPRRYAPFATSSAPRSPSSTKTALCRNRLTNQWQL